MTFIIGAPVCLLGVLMMATIVGILPGLFIWGLGGWPMAHVIKKHLKHMHELEKKDKKKKVLHHEPGIPPWLQDDFNIDDYPYGLN